MSTHCSNLISFTDRLVIFRLASVWKWCTFGCVPSMYYMTSNGYEESGCISYPHFFFNDTKYLTYVVVFTRIDISCFWIRISKKTYTVRVMRNGLMLWKRLSVAWLLSRTMLLLPSGNKSLPRAASHRRGVRSERGVTLHYSHLPPSFPQNLLRPIHRRGGGDRTRRTS